MHVVDKYCVNAATAASQRKFTVGVVAGHITDADSKSNILSSRHVTPASFSVDGRELSIGSIGHG